MATTTVFDWVEVTDRKYLNHRYKIQNYSPSAKVNLTVVQGGSSEILKMSKREAEELIIRLQYAIMEAENGKN